jgi:hypothetical protein
LLRIPEAVDFPLELFVLELEIGDLGAEFLEDNFAFMGDDLREDLLDALVDVGTRSAVVEHGSEYFVGHDVLVDRLDRLFQRLVTPLQHRAVALTLLLVERLELPPQAPLQRVLL